MTKSRRILTFLFVWLTTGFCHGQNNPLWLDDLKIQTFSEGIASVVPIKPGMADSILIGKTRLERGIRVQTTSVMSFFLDGNAVQFSAVVGVDDKGSKSVPVKFHLVGDKKVLFESKKIISGDLPEKVSVNLKGIRRLGLLVTGDEEDHFRTSGYWANAQLVMYGDQSPKQIPNTDEKYILTPSPERIPYQPPGIRSYPVIRSVHYCSNRSTAYGLFCRKPSGRSSLDPQTGIISGKVIQRGTYITALKARNELGEADKKLTIKIGDTIALTPPIGWNGWNSWARNIDGEKVLASANAMVKMGLSNHGWTYINIDDTWEGQRGGKFNGLQPNEKFPKFKEMIDNIHAMGLKLGIYSTPWISTYAGYAGASSDFEKGEYPGSIKNNKRAYRHIGKYRFENEDALQMAEWGVDYLKSDWRIDLNSAGGVGCPETVGKGYSFQPSTSALALAKDWARVSNAWRTGPDIRDSWFLYISAFTIDKWAPFAGPAPGTIPICSFWHVTTVPTCTHTADSRRAQPCQPVQSAGSTLIIGCPIEQLDPFTLNLLTNDEVIAVNQSAGKPARLVADEDGVQTG